MGKEERRVLTLDKYEHGVVINALNEMRNDLIEERRPTDAVDDVLVFISGLIFQIDRIKGQMFLVLHMIEAGNVDAAIQQEHIVRCGQGIDDQHTESGTAIQQNIIIIIFDCVNVLPQYRFPAHGIDQTDFHRRQTPVSGNKVESLMMLYDLWMIAAADTCYDIAHNIAQCQRQIIRLSQPQHFRKVSLGIYIHKQNLFAVCGQTCAEIKYRGTFTHTALLVGNSNDFCFCQGVFLLK